MRRFRFFAEKGSAWLLSLGILSVFLWLQYSVYPALPVVALILVLMRYYYDPDRVLPSHPLGLMCPVDGVVESVELMHDPFINRTSYRIRIRSLLLGVYHARSPTEGKILQFWPVLSADRQQYLASESRGIWHIQTDEGDDVVIAVMSAIRFLKVSSTVQVGERVGQARRFARFPLNSTIDILIDEKSYILVEEGQKVLGGISQIASFNHEQQQV